MRGSRVLGETGRAGGLGGAHPYPRLFGQTLLFDLTEGDFDYAGVCRPQTPARKLRISLSTFNKFFRCSTKHGLTGN